MEWDSKLKKVGNIFNALTFVGLQVQHGAIALGRLGDLVDQTKRVADGLDVLEGTVGTLGQKLESALNSHANSFMVFDKVEGLTVTDQYGTEKPPPHSHGELIAFLAIQNNISLEKIDALVDRLGNQFQNEVLSVLKKENAELEVQVRELKGLLAVKAEATEEKADGDSEADQVEPVPES